MPRCSICDICIVKKFIHFRRAKVRKLLILFTLETSNFYCKNCKAACDFGSAPYFWKLRKVKFPFYVEGVAEGRGSRKTKWDAAAEKRERDLYVVVRLSFQDGHRTVKLLAEDEAR